MPLCCLPLRRVLLGLFAVIFSTLPSLAAYASEPGLTQEEARARDEALELFMQGKLAVKAQDYARALDMFARAQAKFPKEPYIILALAKTLDRAGELEKAKGYYELFLKQAPTDKTDFAADRAATVKRNAEIDDQLRHRPGVLKFKGLPSGALLEVDGKATDVDTQGELKLPAGIHKVRITMDKRLPFERPAVAVGPGEVKEMEVVLPLPVDVRTLPHDYTATIVAGSVAAAGLVATGVFTYLTLQANDDYNQAFDSGTPNQATLQKYTQKDAAGKDILDSNTGKAKTCTLGMAAGTTCPGVTQLGNDLRDKFTSRRLGLFVSGGVTVVAGVAAVLLAVNAPVAQSNSAPAKTAWGILPMWLGDGGGAVFAMNF